MVFFDTDVSINSDNWNSEMVERKGIGHPDTLADLVAEEFSSIYSRYCIENFGFILNHWVDKIVLAGGSTELKFGSSKTTIPIKAYLFGRVTKSVSDIEINIISLFENAVDSIFKSIFNIDVSKYIACIDCTNWTSGTDHPKSFYFPSSATELSKIEDVLKANDTVICTSFAPYTYSERICIDLENYINNTNFKLKYPQTGWDVKVAAIRINRDIKLTICIPLISEKTKSMTVYKQTLVNIKKDLLVYLKNINDTYNYDLSLNTKDNGDYVYLTMFGTALDKGDFGAVGRGNRYEGIISKNRGTNVEATSGKNPLNHSGKIYTILCNEISHKIYENLNLPCRVSISVNNGDNLLDIPRFILVETSSITIKKDRLRINDIIEKSVKKVPEIYKVIINTNAIDLHINKKLNIL